MLFLCAQIEISGENRDDDDVYISGDVNNKQDTNIKYRFVSLLLMLILTMLSPLLNSSAFFVLNSKNVPSAPQ